MGSSTPRAIRLWAWVVCVLTVAVLVVGFVAFFLTEHAAAMAAGLALPWIATGVLGGLLTLPWSKLPRAQRFLRAYAYVAVGAALVGFLVPPEDFGDRVVFAAVSFVFPPMALIYLGVASFWPLTAALAVAAALLMGTIALLPVVVLRRWARFARVRDLVWLAWAASLAAAAGIAGFVESEMDWPALLVVAAVVALAGLWAPIHLAREAGYVQDTGDGNGPAPGSATRADDA